MTYKIISSESTVGLANRVNTELANGWTPIGGVAISHYLMRGADGFTANIDQEEYCQAMVREDAA